MDKIQTIQLKPCMYTHYGDDGTASLGKYLNTWKCCMSEVVYVV